MMSRLLRKHCEGRYKIKISDNAGMVHYRLQARLAVLIRTLVPKVFVTDWPASEGRD